MISVLLYGRNDSYGYNLHKRAAISFNCIAEVLTHPDDEILFVDTNTPDDLPTFPEAIRDTLTPRAKALLRVLRVRPASYEKGKNGTRMKVLEPLCRNVGIRRAHPRNRWILNTNTDMVFVPLADGRSLSDLVLDLPDGLYELPRFEMPEMLWESVDRQDPQAILRQFAHWGRRLHLHEVTLGNPENVFDAPGDFQLAPREQLFAIHGFNERMTLGWHVDSNLARRLFLLNGGRTRSFLDRCHAYHCDHTRVNTMMHTAEGGTANDWRVFVNAVQTPYLPEQADTWGLPEEPVEELRLTDAQANRYRDVLETLLPGHHGPLPQSALQADSFNEALFYDGRHVLPYLTDHLCQIPPTAHVGYVGGHTELLRLVAEFRRGFGHTGRILYEPEAFAAGGGRVEALPPECVPTPLDRLHPDAFVLCFDLWMGHFPKTRNAAGFVVPQPSAEGGRFAAVMIRHLERCARGEKANLDSGSAPPKKFLLLGAQHTWIEGATRQWFGIILTPYSSYVRHGFIRKDAFSQPFLPVPGHHLLLGPAFADRLRWLQRKVGRPVPELEFRAAEWTVNAALAYPEAGPEAPQPDGAGGQLRVAPATSDRSAAHRLSLPRDLVLAALELEITLAEVSGLFDRAAALRQVQAAQRQSPESEPRPAVAAASPRPGPGSPVLGIDARCRPALGPGRRPFGDPLPQQLRHWARLRPDWRFIVVIDGPVSDPWAAAVAGLDRVRLHDAHAGLPEDVDLWHVPEPWIRGESRDAGPGLPPTGLVTAEFGDLAPLRCHWPALSLSDQHDHLSRLAQLVDPRCHVLAGSEFGRREFLQATGAAPDHATLVRPAWGSDAARAPRDIEAVDRVKARYGLSKPFVLHLGTLKPHGNFETVVEVLGGLKAPNGLQLAVVGDLGEEGRKLADFIAANRLRDILLTGFVPAEDLEVLYEQAQALLHLPLYAGSARPVLEALIAGCPVIASQVGSIPEVAGDAGWLFDPKDVAGIRRALEDILSAPAVRETRRTLGREQARRFTSEEAAGRILRIWEQKLGSSRPRPAERNPTPMPAGTRSTPVGVAWEGSFLDLGSLSHVNREISRPLAGKPGIALTCVPTDTLPPRLSGLPLLEETQARLAPARPASARVTVRHAWPPNWERPQTGAWIMIQPWEFGRLPKDWVIGASRADEIWAYTRYVRQVYVDSGVAPDKVKVVPLGIDPEVFRPGAAPLPLPTRKAFKFLFVGGTIGRKGADVLLAAYLQAFRAADDVCLVIKDFGGQGVYAGQTLGEAIRLAQQTPGTPEILHLTHDLSPAEMPALYAACDALVHPYRGEGFGLPVLEAMACGLPVAVTAGGATDDFATDATAYRIPAVRQALGSCVSGIALAGEGWWLEPDRDELAARLRWLTEHREEARAKGAAASDSVRGAWTWNQSAALAADRIRDLAARQTLAPECRGARNGSGSPARPAPAVTRIGALDAAKEHLAAGRFLPAWQAVLGALKLRPFHPEAYLLLAEIAKAAGDLAQARHWAGAAAGLARGWKAARQFLKSLPGKGRPPGIEWPSLPAELGTPKARAHTRLSVCVITRNEEDFITRCLKSVRDVAHQIVVVDTGSTDRTVELARELGAEVHEFAWCDDFSAARNAGLEHATGDWILVLDADEELAPEAGGILVKEMRDDAVMAYRLPIMDAGQEAAGGHYVPRLFRNAPGLCFAGRIHEHAFGSVEIARKPWGLENRLGRARLVHHGYSRELTRSRDKVARNRRLIELALEETPQDANLHLNLGLERVRAGERDAGIECYEHAVRLLENRAAAEVAPELREALLTQLSTHLLAARRFDRIVALLESPLARSSSLSASLHFTLALALAELQRHDAAVTQLRECMAKRDRPALTPADPQLRRGAPEHCLALCLAALRRTAEADLAFRAARAADPADAVRGTDHARFLWNTGQPLEALRVLHELVSAGAGDPSVWKLGGEIALSQPEYLEFARDWTGEALQHCPHDPALMAQRAEALLLGGDCEASLRLWRRLSNPTDLRLRSAGLLCAWVQGESLPAVQGGEEPALSQEFLRWYRRLLSANAHSVILLVHERLGELRAALPTAGRTLETVLAEAGTEVAAAR